MAYQPRSPKLRIFNLKLIFQPVVWSRKWCYIEPAQVEQAGGASTRNLLTRATAAEVKPGAGVGPSLVGRTLWMEWSCLPEGRDCCSKYLRMVREHLRSNKNLTDPHHKDTGNT